MKRSIFCVCSALIASAGPVWPAPLNEKSKTPDWLRATQADKDAWLAAFKFRQSNINKSDVAACLDEHAGRKAFETGDLPGMTQLCGTISKLPE